jgi:hypothetical protein
MPTSTSSTALPRPVTAITLLKPSATFTPRPVIRDLLRTRICVPGSIFLVEAIDFFPTPKTSREWHGVRLLLGDGELCIQALVRDTARKILDSGEVELGSYVKIERFGIHSTEVRAEAEAGGDGTGFGDDEWKGKERENRVKGENSEKREMVFLVLDDLIALGWNNAYRELSRKEERHNSRDQEEVGPNGAHGLPDKLMPDEEFIHDSDLDLSDHNKPSASQLKAPLQHGDSDLNHGDNDSDDFEEMKISPTKATQRRAEASTGRNTIITTPQLPIPVALPRDWTDPLVPLKLTPLRSIPHLPYAQNWTVNVLAVISSLSDVEPSHLAPYTQRTARLADPSTPKHVLLTVFLDPAEFSPRVGNVVLLAGVKNHRFDGGSLKKYASDRPRDGARWWYEEPWELKWCDVSGLKRWWATRGEI